MFDITKMNTPLASPVGALVLPLHGRDEDHEERMFDALQPALIDAIARLQDGPTPEQERAARVFIRDLYVSATRGIAQSAPVIQAHNGQGAIYTLQDLVRHVAVLSFQPGGVVLFGYVIESRIDATGRARA